MELAPVVANVITYIALTATCAGISWLLSRAGILDEPRAFITLKYPNIGRALLCPYCISHWVALALIMISPGFTVDVGYDLLNLVVEWMSIVVGAQILMKQIAEAIISYRPVKGSTTDLLIRFLENESSKGSDKD